jgi:TonB-dependent SusC/RagA subfamily outer membrane receptor
MNKIELFIYLLKTIILSGIFFGYYALFLKNTVYHAYNRFYLLASMALSLTIPFFKFSMFTVSDEQLAGANQVLVYLTELTALPVQEESIAWEIAAIGVISGIFMCYLAYSILRIFRLKAISAKKQMGEFTFIETDLEEAPFSFFTNLFWRKSISMEDDSGRKILEHELSHIRQKHSWDRLFSQLICSLFWMNPFNWIIQKELQNIHEFIADRDAVGEGEVSAFAKMLLQTHYGNHFLNPYHSFYYSSIKRRIFMLTSSKSPKYAYLRKVAVLPMLAFILASFSIQLSAQENKAKNSAGTQLKITALPDSAQKVIPFSNVEVEAISDFDFPSDIKSIESRANSLIIKGNKDGKEITVIVKETNEVIPTSNQDSIVLKPSSVEKVNPLIVIDGVISSELNLNDINPNNIQSMNVLKGEKATAKYAEQGANGVIEITTKKP